MRGVAVLESHHSCTAAVRMEDSGSMESAPGRYSIHGINRIIVNGGYHDAGDLTATGNTPEWIRAVSFAERLQQQGEDPQLRARLMEEATWGYVGAKDELRRWIPHYRTID